MTYSKIPGALVILMPILLASGPAKAFDWAEMLDLRGYIQSDLRYIIDSDRGASPADGRKFQMNRNDVDFRLSFAASRDVQAVIETKMRFDGFNQSSDLAGLSDRGQVDPFRIHLEEAYLSVRGFLTDYMDLKVGRMIQSWGSADMFNPTDNLNARDFSDPLDYAAKVPNQMIELSAYPADWLTLTAVWVPVFKPAMLPPSAVLGFAVERDRNGCLIAAPTPPLRNRADAEALGTMFSAMGACGLNFADPEVLQLKPEFTLANSQYALRAQFKLGELDFSLSYFRGRFPFPIAYTAIADVGASPNAPGIVDVKYTAEVMYPRMHVLGLDFSYSAPWLLDIGFIGEMAVIFPEKVIFGLRANQNGQKLLEMSSENVPSDPFIKASAGIDYTFTKWFYLNTMYVRGFIDEFNDTYGIHNYWVNNMDFKFFDDELMLRMSSVLSIDDLSATIYPQITWVVKPSVELGLGAFVYIGDTQMSDPLDYAAKDKFGQKAVGRSVAYFRTKLYW